MNDMRDNSALPYAGPAGGGAAATADAASDPLHNLYRMSRTAGLGSGDYVAINNTAVIAFLMGLASVLALLSTFLLLFAVVAVILGVMALVQIRSSNGTQTGRAFAIVGILLALTFGGTTGAKMALAQAQQRREEAAIGKAIELLGQRLMNREYEQAYGALFSDKFREDFPNAEFMTRWEGLDRDAGAIQSVTWGGRAEFQPPRATGERRARAKAIFKFEKVGDSIPMMVGFVEQEGEWVIEGLGELFNAESERQRQQQRAPTGSPIMGPQSPDAP